MFKKLSETMIEACNEFDTEKINLQNNYSPKEISIDDVVTLEKDNGNFIYIITGKKNKNVIYDDIKNKFDKFKNQGYKLSQINEENWENNSNCLYVGSSQNINKRLKEHCIKSSNSTYSLKLDVWNKNDNFFSDIKIYLFKFNNSIEVVKCLEVMLSKDLNPLFGQKTIR